MENNPLWVKMIDIFKKNIRLKDIIRTLEDQYPRYNQSNWI